MQRVVFESSMRTSRLWRLPLVLTLIAKKYRGTILSPTYYANGVIISGGWGMGPTISFPMRDCSLHLFSWKTLWKLRDLASGYLDKFEEAALVARRARLLGRVAEGLPESRALLHYFKYV